MKYYMHTLDGMPAAYMPRERQICFLSHYGNRNCNVLATSLQQIRKEQRLSRKYRQEVLGIDADVDYEAGYVIVNTPQEDK